MRIQKATSADLKKVLDVYNNAREYMRTHNNGDQWGESYPPRELVERTLDKTYLCMEGDQLACVFYYAVENEECYSNIEGKWLNESPYAVVHRIASTEIAKGAAAFCLNWAYQQFPNVRIDTYKDNYPMQRLLKKCGFSYCGTFEMQGKNGWMAFQKTKTDEKNDADGLQSTKCSFE